MLKPSSLLSSLVLTSALALSLSAASAPDLPALISRADLRYPAPVTRSEDGLPVGNGRMGSLVWTSPTALRFQINRNDVQSVNKDTNSFWERNTDYMGGCGYVDIELAGAGDDVFVADNCPQHLSVYDGLLTLNGRGVTSRVLAWPAQDVMAIEVDDQRAKPEPLSVNLRMLRQLSQHYGSHLETMVKEHMIAVRTRDHVATSQLHIRGDRIVLTQEFKEGQHLARSAIAIAFLDRAARPHFANETTVRLDAPAAKGRATILISSAASLDANEDIVAAALRPLDAAVAKKFSGLAADTAAWWHQFWSRGSVALHSADGTAEFIADNYHYFLYVMGASSRGKYPTKFNGMLWNTGGDLRTWGVQHWFANLSCTYEALYAANRLELLDPVFDMYSGQFDAAALAAKQQWGSQGIYIPETVWFDGLAKLPDEIAAEMSDLYLMRKPWAQRSPQFVEFAKTKLPHSSRWNWWGGGSWINGQWVPTERGNGPYGPVTHILGTTAKVAYLYWRRYEYTLDREWLRTRAYPMLKGAAEFYRNFPNFKKDGDGKFHIHHTNSNESVQDVRDSDEDHAAMRGIFAAAARAAEILDVDATLRAQWRDTLAQLAPIPTSADPDALKPADYTGPTVFVRGRTPAVVGRGLTPDGNSLPHFFFDLISTDAPADLLATANATFDRSLRNGLNEKTAVGVLSKMAIAGTTLGRVDATRYMIPNQIRSLTAEREGVYRGGLPLANKLSLREGAQAFDAQRLGRAAEALHIALLDTIPPGPAQESSLRLFHAWPKDWDATYTLRARGAFVVTASQKHGRAESVEIVSEAGATCRLHNPWGEAEITLQRAGKPAEKVRGGLLTIPTQVGERITLTP